MLFGARPEFNTEICRRVLTFDEHMNPDYSKEHVKPILNTHEILAVRNLYTYHSIVEPFKVIKFRTPYCIYEKFTIADRRAIFRLPSMKFVRMKQIFLYSAPYLWNVIHNYLIEPFTVNKYKITSISTQYINIIKQFLSHI